MRPFTSPPDDSASTPPPVLPFEARLTSLLRRPLTRTIMALPMLTVLLSLSDPHGATAAVRVTACTTQAKAPAAHGACLPNRIRAI